MALPFLWGVASDMPTLENVEFTKIILNIDLWFCVWDILRDRIDPKRRPFPTASAPSAAPTAIGPRNITSSAGSMRARPTSSLVQCSSWLVVRDICYVFLCAKPTK